jgi:hypothetical protein
MVLNNWVLSGTQKGRFLEQFTDCRRLSGKAVAWLSAGSSILSRESMDMCCVLMRLLPCGCSHINPFGEEGYVVKRAVKRTVRPKRIVHGKCGGGVTATVGALQGWLVGCRCCVETLPMCMQA